MLSCITVSESVRPAREVLFNILSRVHVAAEKKGHDDVSGSGARLERFENRAAARAKRIAALGRFGERTGYPIHIHIHGCIYREPLLSYRAFQFRLYYHSLYAYTLREFTAFQLELFRQSFEIDFCSLKKNI